MSASSIIIPAGFGGIRESERKVEAVSREAILRVSAANDVLQAWGLQLVCPQCSRIFGMGRDGVEANNDPRSTVLEVRCGCTVRRCVIPG